MTHFALTALVNGMAGAAMIAVIVGLILRITSGAWNATTREAVWWFVLAASITMPAIWLFPASAPAAVTVSPDSVQPALKAPPPDGPQVPSVPNQSPSLAPAPAFPLQVPAGRWASWAVGFWAAAAVLLLTRLIVSYALLQRRKARAINAPDKIATLAASSNRPIRIAVSADLSGPVAAGPVRPTILIPDGLLDKLQQTEIEQIILHEVAHFRRRDDYWIIVQRIVEALFVLHPVVRWLTRRIELEREIACDDFVINISGEQRGYAMCLTRVMELSRPLHDAGLAASAWARRSHLERRVDMLLNGKRKRMTSMLKVRLGGMAAALALLALGVFQLPGAFVFLPPAAAQTAQQGGTNVRVPVLVTDTLGRYVSGLERDHFRIQEDGRQQTISEFFPDSSAGNDISVFVAFYENGGVRPVTEKLRDELLRLRRPTDEFVASARFGVEAEALIALRTAIRWFELRKNPRAAILVISENNDTAYSAEEIRRLAVSSDVPIFGVTIGPSSPAETLMRDLTQYTGGAHFTLNAAASDGEVTNVASKTLAAIRTFYVLTFESQNGAQGGAFRAISVEVTPPRGIRQLLTFHRAGYFPSPK